MVAIHFHFSDSFPDLLGALSFVVDDGLRNILSISNLVKRNCFIFLGDFILQKNPKFGKIRKKKLQQIIFSSKR